MKFLLTVLASMMITGSAMAACDTSSPKDCTTESECKGLNKDGGAKYTFSSTSAVKCMLVDTSVATKCVDGNDSGRGLNGKTGTDATKEKAAAGVTK